jgi:hypothetical protein
MVALYLTFNSWDDRRVRTSCNLDFKPFFLKRHRQFPVTSFGSFGEPANQRSTTCWSNFEGLTLETRDSPHLSLGPFFKTFFQALETWELMFDIEIWEVYSVSQEVPEQGRQGINIGQIHDIWRFVPVAFSLFPARSSLSADDVTCNRNNSCIRFCTYQTSIARRTIPFRTMSWFRPCEPTGIVMLARNLQFAHPMQLL